MVIGIIGENCSGKSTLAGVMQSMIGGEIVMGMDYLRMAKSESEAEALFRAKLENAVSGKHVIYVIAEPEHIDFLPAGAVRILVKADIETIKERFKARLRGNLPAPVAQMLERNHGRFDHVAADYQYDGAEGNPEAFCEQFIDELRCDRSEQ